jgi:hypothetical protein
MSGSFVYLCVDTSSFSDSHTIAGFIPLPSPGEGRYDDDFFQRLRRLYGKIRGARSVRNVSSFKFVKVDFPLDKTAISEADGH